jgi:serine protease Do
MMLDVFNVFILVPKPDHMLTKGDNMTKRTLSLSILVVLAMLTLSACGGIALSTNSSNVNSAPPQAAAAPTKALVAPATGSDTTSGSSSLLAAYQGTLENIYSTISPSVVNISVEQVASGSNTTSQQIPGFPFFSFPQGQQQAPQQYQAALGSGFVWDTNGDIVTNNHVISGAASIQVTFSDGKIVPAKLVGADPYSDLAVIKVDVPANQLHPVTLANSNDIKVGQLAVAIGEPFGLEGTMTTGIISAVGRSLPANLNASQSYSIPDVIQTDAPINPGNSGGVLVDAAGHVVGVTSAIESPSGSSAGIGFAIPSSIVNNVIPSLISTGKYVHTWLGISGTNLVPELATAMNLNASQRGALVEEVMPNSPAEKAGLQSSTKQVTIFGQTATVGGDVIIAINNQPVVQMDDLIAYLANSTKVGQTVTLTILRNGKQQNVDVTLEARPTSNASSSTTTAQSGSTQGITLGILGTTVDSSIANAMNLPNGVQGVLVTQVEPGSLAETAGLRGGNTSVTINGQQVEVGGDIITAVNNQPVTSIQDLKAALSQLSSNQSLSLSILRNGTQLQITVQPGQ